jgi:hypothetical protein
MLNIEGFWLWYMLSTWLRQVVDELVHIHEVDYKLRYRLMHGSDLLVQFYSGISHSDSVTVVPSFYFYFRVAGRDKDRWL